MRRWRRTIPLLSAVSLIIALAYPGRPSAAETAVISSTPASQADITSSLQPPANEQAAPYQLEPSIGAPDPPGLREYMEANEQISVFGVAMRVETRIAEKEIQ